MPEHAGDGAGALDGALPRHTQAAHGLSFESVADEVIYMIGSVASWG